MKVFFSRLGIATGLVLGGILTGYLWSAPAAKSLSEELMTLKATHLEQVKNLETQLGENKKAMALRDALLALHRTKWDLGSANYGLAGDRLDTVQEALQGIEKEFPADSKVKLGTAVKEIDGIKPTISNQDASAVLAIDKIIRDLEPTL